MTPPPLPARARTGLRLVGQAGAVVGLLGLGGVLVGTFAPWVDSGGVLRNSYAIVGIVGRLGLAGTGFRATALSLWPFIGPVAMVALIAAILRWWRSAAVIAVLFGLLTGVIGGGVLAVAGGHGAAGVELAYAGPVITLTGGIGAVIGGVLVLIAGRRPPAVTDLGHNPYQGNPAPVLSVDAPREHRTRPAGRPVDQPMYPRYAPGTDLER